MGRKQSRFLLFFSLSYSLFLSLSFKHFISLFLSHSLFILHTITCLSFALSHSLSTLCSSLYLSPASSHKPSSLSHHCANKLGTHVFNPSSRLIEREHLRNSIGELEAFSLRDEFWSNLRENVNLSGAFRSGDVDLIEFPCLFGIMTRLYTVQ